MLCIRGWVISHALCPWLGRPHAVCLWLGHPHALCLWLGRALLCAPLQLPLPSPLSSWLYRNSFCFGCWWALGLAAARTVRFSAASLGPLRACPQLVSGASPCHSGFRRDCLPCCLDPIRLSCHSGPVSMSSVMETSNESPSALPTAGFSDFFFLDCRWNFFPNTF